jgi:AmmeMemoRadiSam system protein A
MMSEELNRQDRITLLRLARTCIEYAVSGRPLPRLYMENYSPELRTHGASFVTLTINGALRGCIGILEAVQPLVQDVCEHAVAAAFEDYRFSAVRAAELPRIDIEISRLTPKTALEYQDSADLLSKIRPGIDGVVLVNGLQRATFLPQVWEKIPEKEQFLNMLCEKMGALPDLWRRKKLDVWVYQVEEFHEYQFEELRKI